MRPGSCNPWWCRAGMPAVTATTRATGSRYGWGRVLQVKYFANLLLVVLCLKAGPCLSQEVARDPSGLKIDVGFEIVKAYCTACHSAKLIEQSGKTREGWIDSIRWMQRNQGLWDLGDREAEILDYLAKHYGLPKIAPRRALIPAHLMPK
jgi:Quinohemoprotein amine dehydrogenase A, alpha subunit, haem binding